MRKPLPCILPNAERGIRVDLFPVQILPNMPRGATCRTSVGATPRHVHIGGPRLRFSWRGLYGRGYLGEDERRFLIRTGRIGCSTPLSRPAILARRILAGDAPEVRPLPAPTTSRSPMPTALTEFAQHLALTDGEVATLRALLSMS